VSTDEQHLDHPNTEESPATPEAESPSSATDLAEPSAAPATEDTDEPESTGDRSDEAVESGGDVPADASGHDQAADGSDDDGSDDDGSDDDGEAADESGERKGRRTGGSGDLAARLEREGEIAADFLERLLDIADLDGDLDVDVEGERASIAIVDSSEGRVPRRLVGQNGEVLEALQELTRLAVQARTGDRTRLMLDVAGHRAHRREQLVARAQEAITEVRDSGEPLRLEAMNPFERKIVHDAVSAAGLSSSSEGVEPDRRIVVRPAS
jgi:spoIIIJ-associated protein